MHINCKFDCYNYWTAIPEKIMTVGVGLVLGGGGVGGRDNFADGEEGVGGNFMMRV